MTSTSSENWKASWIWGAGVPSPRNEWRCFRKGFIWNPASEQLSEKVALRITADSRYVLFINGMQVGRGPVRSWPFELAYDEYEIGQFLQTDQENVIAVLVTHYGISNFQYIRGRGGLLVECSGYGVSWGTDASWKTNIHHGYDTRSSRISCQLAFSEHYDARVGDSSWVQASYDDSTWAYANVLGPVGMEPWTKLVARDIPFLKEEPVYPAHVHALHAVKPPAWSVVMDLHAMMDSQSGNHANPIHYCGLLASRLYLDQEATLTCAIVDGGHLANYPVGIDGIWFDVPVFTGDSLENTRSVALSQGEHLLLIDVTGFTHGHSFHFAMDCPIPFRVEALDTSHPGPFSLVGPFEVYTPSHFLSEPNLQKNHPDYLRIREAKQVASCTAFQDWIHPIVPNLINPVDVFANHVWRTLAITYPVPTELLSLTTIHPSGIEIPIFHPLDTEIILDFGRELSGYVQFTIEAPAGTIVEGYGFEYLHGNWRQHTFGVDNTFRYTCSQGQQTFRSLIRRGLRYLAVTIRKATQTVKINEIKLWNSHYPVEDVGQFTCSDPLLNDIWHISRETTRLCMEDTFVDCPTYEQAFWVGDARNESLISYYAFGPTELVERCLRLVPGSRKQTPYYVNQVPSGWNSVIPNWTFFWISACLEYYQYRGKLEFLNHIWPSIASTVQHYLTHVNSDGLLQFQGWNFLDWAQFEQPTTGIVTHQNMFFARALREAAEIATLVGDTHKSEFFLQQAHTLRTVINKKLWDSSRKIYLDCIHEDGAPSKTTSMQTHIVAYLCRIADSEQEAHIVQYLLQPPEHFVQMGSPFMAFFYYEAIERLQRSDLMLAHMRKHYGSMIEHGATTCWETFPWSGYAKNEKELTRSHCHAWSAAPGYFLGAYVLGVKGIDPGWSKVRVQPNPVDLAWAKGTVPLPQGGQIDISWQVVDKLKLDLQIHAPAYLEVLIELPAGWTRTG